MPVHTVTITEQFSAEPDDVLTLVADAARWREWTGPLLRRGRPAGFELDEKHAYELPPVWPFLHRVGRLSTRARPGGGGELEWSFSFRTRDPVVGVAT